MFALFAVPFSLFHRRCLIVVLLVCVTHTNFERQQAPNSLRRSLFAAWIFGRSMINVVLVRLNFFAFVVGVEQIGAQAAVTAVVASGKSNSMRGWRNFEQVQTTNILERFKSAKTVEHEANSTSRHGILCFDVRDGNSSLRRTMKLNRHLLAVSLSGIHPDLHIE